MSRSNILFLIIGALVIAVAVMGMSCIKIASSPKACASTLGPMASRLKRNRNCRRHLACDVETLCRTKLNQHAFVCLIVVC